MSVDLSVYDIGDLGLEEDDDGYDSDCYYDDDYSYETETATSYDDSQFSYGDLTVDYESEDDEIADNTFGLNGFKSSLPEDAFQNTPVYHLTETNLERARNLTSILTSNGDTTSFASYMESLEISNEVLIAQSEETADLECKVNDTSLLPCEVTGPINGSLTKQERKAIFKELRNKKRRYMVANKEEVVPYLLKDQRVKGTPGEHLGVIDNIGKVT